MPVWTGLRLPALALSDRDSSPQFRVYNLCSERCYTADTFEKGGAKPELGGGELGGQCAYYPFDDHNPAPLETIKACCDDMAAFLDADAANVVAVHCKAGKVSHGPRRWDDAFEAACACRVATAWHRAALQPSAARAPPRPAPALGPALPHHVPPLPPRTRPPGIPSAAARRRAALA